VIAFANLATGNVRIVAGNAGSDSTETAYDPTLSGNGDVVAYQSVTADPMSPSTHWATRIRLRDLRSGAVTTVPRDGAYDASVSGDGRRVAFTAFSQVGTARRRMEVFVFDRRTRKVTLVSRLGRGAERAAEAWDPSLSRNGRRVAFAATTKPGGRARVYVRDLAEHTSRAVSEADRGFSSEPSISADGRRVAYSELASGGKQSAAGRPLQRLLVRTLGGGEHVVSVGADGRALSGWSGQPQISGDGRHVAFTTDAGTPAGGGPGGLKVMVTDLAAGTSRIANPPAPLGSFDSTPALQPAKSLCSLAPPAW
jgi:Tol biopolymer transport system component